MIVIIKKILSTNEGKFDYKNILSIHEDQLLSQKNQFFRIYIGLEDEDFNEVKNAFSQDFFLNLYEINSLSIKDS